MTRDKWTFGDYIEEIIALSEILEIPGIQAKRSELLKEVWKKFPQECYDLGLRDGVSS
jgi:hypothetical protein